MYRLMALSYNCAECVCKPVSILNSNWLHWKRRALGASWKTDLARSSVPSADMHSVYKHHSAHWQNTATAERGENRQPGEGKTGCSSAQDTRFLFLPFCGLCDLGQATGLSDLRVSIFKPGYEVKHVKGNEMVRYNGSGNCVSMNDRQLHFSGYNSSV